MTGYGLLIGTVAVAVVVVGTLVALTLGGVLDHGCVYDAAVGYQCGVGR